MSEPRSETEQGVGAAAEAGKAKWPTLDGPGLLLWLPESGGET